MKKFIIYLSILAASFAMPDCSGDAHPGAAQILVKVTGECICNVFIYTPEGLCLQSKIWDCQQTTVLIFEIHHTGQLTVKAEFLNKSSSQTITARPGQSLEITIIL